MRYSISRSARAIHNVAMDSIHVNDFPDIPSALHTGMNLGRCVLFTTGVYNITTPIDIRMSADLNIHIDLGARLVGAAGLSAPMLQFDGHTNWPKLFISGHGVLDNSLTTFVPGEQSGTCLSMKRVKQMTVSGIEFTAGSNFNTDGGDSGITAQQCRNILITGCRFLGQPDLGIYLTGGGLTDTEDDSNTAIIENNYFWQCSGAASSKRLYKRVVFQNNFVQECRSGFSLFEALLGSVSIPPGIDCVVSGNIFNKIETRAVDLRACAHGSIVSGNVLRDWGVYLNGVSAGAASDLQHGMRFLGCQGVVVANNDLALDAWSVAAHVGLDFPDFSNEGVDYLSKNNFVHGNKIADALTGVRSTGTGPNIFFNNFMPGVTTEYSTEDTSFIMSLDDTGLSVGRTSPTTLNADGVGIAPSGQLTAVRLNSSPGVFVRRNSFGDTVRVYQKASDGVQPVIMGALASHDGGGLEIKSEASLKLTPGGGSLVQFGTKTTTPVVTDGYVTIKDSAGNTVKLATVS